MKAYVYAIRSHQTDKIYIGSTTQTPSMRMCGHRASYKRWKNKKTNYVTSYEILKYNDNYIEILVEVDFTTNLELKKLEGENIRKHDCVNKCIAGRTQIEYKSEHKIQVEEYQAEYRADHKKQSAEYYQDHKEHHAELVAINYQNNKKKILEKNAIIYTCTCGSVLCMGAKSKHEKTKKHQAFINQSVIPSDNIL